LIQLANVKKRKRTPDERDTGNRTQGKRSWLERKVSGMIRHDKVVIPLIVSAGG